MVFEQDQVADLGDHFPVVVKKMTGRSRGRKAGRVGFLSEDEKLKFQELTLCPSGARDWVNHKGDGDLVASQERLEGTAAAVKSTTAAISNKNKFMILDEIREMAPAAAAKCRIR